ncbi:hypothetical protein Peur_027341 [Populus x canadensis]
MALESGVKQEASDSGRITKYDKHISRQPQPKSSLSSSTKRSLKVFLENNNPCKAIWCYYKMLVANARPNKCTYPTLFKACSAAEAAEEGGASACSLVVKQGLSGDEWEIFNSMKEVYEMERYGCVVDLLGRAGPLGDAEELIYSVPIEPSAAAWGALLGACRKQGDVELDGLHPQMKKIFLTMKNMLKMLEIEYYSPNTSQVIFDIEEEEKEAELRNHSEKFAIAFGFINTASNSNTSCEEFKDE